MVDKARRVVSFRVATAHHIPAYGGTELPEEMLRLIADSLLTGQVPFQLQHDPTRLVDAECISAEVVALPDGHRAVDAVFEVDAEAWQTYEAECAAAGVSGGFSISLVQYFAETDSTDVAGRARFSVVADASYFGDGEISSSARKLAPLGVVRIGRLYQFAHDPACRIVVEFLLSGTANLSWGVVSAALYDCIKSLKARRKRAPVTAGVSQVELHQQSGDGSKRVFLVRSDSDEVIRHAIETMVKAFDGPERLEWNETSQEWRSP